MLAAHCFPTSALFEQRTFDELEKDPQAASDPSGYHFMPRTLAHKASDSFSVYHVRSERHSASVAQK